MQFLEKLSDKLSERSVGIVFTILVLRSACECGVSTCMFVCVHNQVCLQVHVHTCACGDLKLMTGALLSHSLPYTLRQVVSLEPRFANSGSYQLAQGTLYLLFNVRLACTWVLGIQPLLLTLVHLLRCLSNFCS